MRAQQLNPGAPAFTPRSLATATAGDTTPSPNRHHHCLNLDGSIDIGATAGSLPPPVLLPLSFTATHSDAQQFGSYQVHLLAASPLMMVPAEAAAVAAAAAAAYASHSEVGMGVSPHHRYAEQAQPPEPTAPRTPTNVVVRRRRSEEIGSSSVNVTDRPDEDDGGIGQVHQDVEQGNGVGAGKEAQEGQTDGIMERHRQLQAGELGDNGGEGGQSSPVDGGRNGSVGEGERAGAEEEIEWEKPTELGGGTKGGPRHPRYSRIVQSKSEPVMVGTVRQPLFGGRVSEFGC